MAIAEGLKTALNGILETAVADDRVYAKYIDQIRPDTDIKVWAKPILDNQAIMNDFFNMLVQRIMYTQIETKLFDNPLQVLEGDQVPLGSIGQEIYTNPIKGRLFNVDDFAGLLAKYEADVKVQYMHVNSDIQYPVTVTRAKIVDAFTSWENLNSFIDSITNALYNGAYIDRFRMSKDLVSSAYMGNNVQIEVVDEITTPDLAKAFVKKARNLYKMFKFPSTKYNAWGKVGGYGREILTWCNPNDIVILLRADISTELDVEVLANAFNMDKTTLMGRVLDVDNFDIYDGDTKVFDGSKILGIVCDSRWFRIKTRELTMDEFYNANNRTWQFYLNDVRMYQYSLFANAVVFATELPNVGAESVLYDHDGYGGSFDINLGEQKTLGIIVTPTNATSETTFTSSNESAVTVTKIDDRHVRITGVGTGEAFITASNNGHEDVVGVTVIE